MGKTTVGGREILRIHFTKDGMVDPEAYEVSSCKILVVLKEANIADNKNGRMVKGAYDRRSEILVSGIC